MVTINNTPVPREDVWRAFRQAHDARLRERSHGILLLMEATAVLRWRRGCTGRRTPFGAGCTPSTRTDFKGWNANSFRGAPRD